MTGVRLLRDGWRLRGFLGDDWQLHRAQLHARDAPDDDTRWIPARVPGSVLADLRAAGRIPDPYVGTRSLLAEWVPQRTWVHRIRFTAPATGRGERTFLEFDGIDHAGSVHLDGERIADHEGMFVPLVVEVTGRLDPGEHTLAVVVEPAPVSEPQVGRTSVVRAHKSRMNYGWDFCPRLVHQGIWGPVRLRVTGAHRLADVWARPALAGDRGRVEVTVRADSGPPAAGTVRCVLTDPDGGVVATGRAPLTGPVARVDLTVEGVRRWWPNGLGRPELHTLTTELVDGDGWVSDSHRTRIGFRDVRFRCDPDAPSGALPYRLTVDGRPTVIKGWNWVPADVLYGAVGGDRLRHLLGLARDAGVNLLRVWGGGLIESESFYDLCDEFGLLVWQEFAQSSSGMESTPSADPAFVARMVAEAERIVPTRRNHPSLALWCGGNELQRPDGVPLTDDDSPVLAALHGVVARLDPDRHWLPTSPTGPVFGNTLASVADGPEHHDVHGPWEHQGLADHYRLHDSGRALLLSEFGVEGMGNPRGLTAVVPEPQRRLPTAGDPVWDHLGRWWNNEALVRRAFGDALADLPAIGRASQFLQADGLRYAVEATRRRPACCGVLPWQLNESFPNGWCTSAVDWYGEPKAVYHHVRRAYRPLHVCAATAAPRVDGPEFTATVWAWWDGVGDPVGRDDRGATGRDDGGTAEVTARVLRLDGTEVTARRWSGPLAAGRPRAFGPIDCPTAALGGGPFLLDLAVRLGDRSAGSRQTLTAGADFRALADLPPARVDVDLTGDGETWRIRLRHRGGPVAPFLRLLDDRPTGPGPVTDTGWPSVDDNAIDLLPGEERTLTVRWTGVPPEERRLRLDGWNVPALTLGGDGTTTGSGTSAGGGTTTGSGTSAGGGTSTVGNGKGSGCATWN